MYKPSGIIFIFIKHSIYSNLQVDLKTGVALETDFAMSVDAVGATTYRFSFLFSTGKTVKLTDFDANPFVTKKLPTGSGWLLSS